MSSFCPKSNLNFRRKMTELQVQVQPLLNEHEDDEESQQQQQQQIVVEKISNRRIASLDVFRGLSIFLMVVVDYAGSSLPIIAHAPWNGLHLADFVMPIVSFLQLEYLLPSYTISMWHVKVQCRYEATWKAIVRAVKLFVLGVFLQGGYLHGITSLTYGVDVETIRLLGILQRIAIGYIVAAVCEIWLPRQTWKKEAFLRNYIWHWCAVFFLCTIYIGLTYGQYVADWQFNDLYTFSSLVSENGTTIHTVKMFG
ncbi:putative heparan-alpha-glucosaminide N-acetyltransferase [Helianthus annuus]|nr:putative heparan-alpha-glucosaminide N-acetyltransferase [Helianthus annuus]